MLNPQRVVAKRVSKLLVLSLMVPGSVFAAEASPAIPHNVAVASNTAQIVGPNTVLPQIPAGTRKAPLTAGSVDWSSLNNQHLVSTKMLCGNTASNVCFAPQIEQAYAQNKFYPLWNTVALRKELTAQLQMVADSKMLPGISQRLSELNKLEQQGNLRGYDLLATDTYYVYRAFLNYIAHNRNVLFLSEPLNMSQVMVQYGSDEDAYPMTIAKLTTYRPTYIPFESTMKMIEKYQQLAPHHLTRTSFKSTVYRPGDVLPNGHDVVQVLYHLGDLSQADHDALSVQPTVKNAGALLASIKLFQKRHGLTPDGIVGSATIKQLAMPYSDIARLLALNTLRMSALNRHNDTRAHIWVNIPNYKLELYDNGQKMFESKVIVGRDTRPTNLFSSAITTMVVNPYWNVPVTIKQHDVIPKVKLSRDYLKAHNMQILNSWRDRTVVPPSSIDWETVNPKTFPHEFQQGPGPHNSLGRVKFLMPNDYAIFLHDTPSRGLFNRNKRDLSSGCVRVERADDLANYVIDYQKRNNIDSFKSMLDTQKNKVVSLSKRIDVDFVYLTAWVDQNGHLQMRNDIYGYDSPQATPIKTKFVTMKDFVKR
ncbi:L,D-transpeptidase family protein [Photobacterium aquimaris]|uniref:Amidase n=1 Tax=Photobacterium aquimaris TaxID=512643 RepID=A0A2T3HTH0_9GAMM|nr:L,D-transpeptidase family protein [Photobacterium aquimaris]OBU21069.1 amidase [Photobacterium aquimaris]PQJ41004.1 amidase [Photobacterium aquimaris]PST98340.1 amidase [Photobacterium aquimaris]